MANCFQNVKGCEVCQLHGLIQRASIDLLTNKQTLVMQGMNYIRLEKYILLPLGDTLSS